MLIADLRKIQETQDAVSTHSVPVPPDAKSVECRLMLGDAPAAGWSAIRKLMGWFGIDAQGRDDWRVLVRGVFPGPPVTVISYEQPLPQRIRVDIDPSGPANFGEQVLIN